MRIWIAVVMLLVTAGCGKPDISQKCKMNSFGQGLCSFANKGTAKGSVCGHVEVSNLAGQTAMSRDFCSGEVAENTTLEKAFIVEIEELCGPGGIDIKLSDKCSFGFVEVRATAASADDKLMAEAEDKVRADAERGAREAEMRLREVEMKTAQAMLASKMAELEKAQAALAGAQDGASQQKALEDLQRAQDAVKVARERLDSKSATKQEGGTR
ncbi:MAG: hypothetical protein PHU25_17220 [Deltaproteobacteria bacterium]|nr:hypothetical protein [Deltaproteobacteria bacterium]